MYAIRSRKTQRWFLGIDTHYGRGSSHFLIMDNQIPQLFKTKQLAQYEIIINGMRTRTFEIIEVDVAICV